MYIRYTIVNLLLLLGIYNDIMGKSHEQRLINKEHMEMYNLSIKIFSFILQRYNLIAMSLSKFLTSSSQKPDDSLLLVAEQPNQYGVPFVSKLGTKFYCIKSRGLILLHKKSRFNKSIMQCTKSECTYNLINRSVRFTKWECTIYQIGVYDLLNRSVRFTKLECTL